MYNYSFTVFIDDDGKRLDQFLAQQLDQVATDQFSRTYISRLIRDGQINVNGKIADKVSSRVQSGQCIDITIPDTHNLDLEAVDLKLSFVYQDDHIAIVNKPPGLTVHPGAGVRQATLVQGLMFAMSDLSGINGIERPGIVHRLDKETQGLMVIAKHDQAHRNLAEQFRDRKVKKVYRAVLWGQFPDKQRFLEGMIVRDPVQRVKMKVIESRSAPSYAREIRTGVRCQTNFIVPNLGHLSYVFVDLFTGRTHQIRAHLHSAGFPIVGDTLYANRKSAYQGEMLLQSCSLTFTHPATKEEMNFVLPLPASFRTLLNGYGASESDPVAQSVESYKKQIARRDRQGFDQ